MFLIKTSVSVSVYKYKYNINFNIECLSPLFAGERSNQCPSGFVLDPAGPYCSGTFYTQAVFSSSRKIIILAFRRTQHNENIEEPILNKNLFLDNMDATRGLNLADIKNTLYISVGSKYMS